ncbi:PrsW family intramembrane metalloprotease [Amycolatopsis sp. NPDC098790]|uniref:PrsW family intramembrane metalloprotease n=1 Tax=Amycolatopsis sp. NPDC098790 TaxID=3363939 RepID=UPI0037F45D85
MTTGRRDTRTRDVLAVAIVLSAAYGCGMLLDWFKPGVDDSVPLVGIGEPVKVWPFDLVRACVVASWGLALVTWALARLRPPVVARPAMLADNGRSLKLATAAVLLLPFLIRPVAVLGGNLVQTAICVPSTAFAFWAITRMQRYRRMPARLPAAAFAWGGFVAVGFGAAMNSWLDQYGMAYLVDVFDLLRDPASAVGEMRTARALNAALFEELGKAAGIAVVYFGFRRHIDGLVSGLVLGAAIGLGFNFSESVLYMGEYGTGVSAYQYWLRQSVGLFAAHVALTAVVGAAFGVARQLRGRRRRTRVVACGFVVAVTGHFTVNALAAHMLRATDALFGDNPWLANLVGTPLTVIVLQGPVVVLYLLLLRRGLRAQAGAMAVELPLEVRTGYGAITTDEVSALQRPARRFFVTVKALRNGGFPAYRHLRRLHAAQFDLAAQRWHRSRGEVDPWSPAEALLRDRVLRLKDEGARTTPVPPAAEVES